MFAQASPEKSNSSSYINRKKQQPFFSPVIIQPKLAIGSRDDQYEREADEVTEKVMNMPVSKNQFFKPGQPSVSQLQRKCQHCEEEEKLNRKENSSLSAESTGEIPSYINSLSSKGSALPDSTRRFFEPRFGYDFSDVKIHTDSAAVSSSQSLNALAYTVGNNIVFNQSQFSPDSENGKKLLAHELTHVVQHRANNSMISRQAKPDNLTPEKRQALVGSTRGRIVTCASYFNTALLEVKIKVGKMLEEQKSNSDTLFEIAFGLLMPGLGKVLGKGLASLAETIPATASTTTYKAALALLNEEKTKEIFVKATETGRKAAKINFDKELKSITGNATYEDFFNKLNTSAAAGFDDIQVNLESRTDDELGVLFLTYNPTAHDFVREIESLFFKFQKQVEPIGKKTDDRYGPILARWVEGNTWKALALTGEGRYYNVGGAPQFITWISPEMKNAAIEATIKIRGMIDTVHYKTIQATGAGYIMFESLLNNDDSINTSGKDITLERASGTVHAPTARSCPGCHGETHNYPDQPHLLDAPPFNLNSPETQKQLKDWIELNNSTK